jgi:hypothetical protein
MTALQTSEPARPPASAPRHDPRPFLLNILIVAMAILVAVLAWSLISRTLLRPPVQTQRAGTAPAAAGTPIQLDVLNGCGTPGAAVQFTSYLRARGYDVVEVRNYKTFDVNESMVVDRVGNMQNAERIAYALGVRKENILQQMNPDYYVDVSVVIGRDYHALKPSQVEGTH